MKKPSPFPARFAAAIVAAAGIMLAVPTLAQLVVGGPVETPLAWSSLSLGCTVLAALSGVTYLAWRPPSGWAALVAGGVTAAAMTILPILIVWDDRGWQMLVIYLVVYGVYFAIILALMTAAVVLHGRRGLSFRGRVRARG